MILTSFPSSLYLPCLVIRQYLPPESSRTGTSAYVFILLAPQHFPLPCLVTVPLPLSTIIALCLAYPSSSIPDFQTYACAVPPAHPTLTNLLLTFHLVILLHKFLSSIPVHLPTMTNLLHCSASSSTDTFLPFLLHVSPS